MRRLHFIAGLALATAVAGWGGCTQQEPASGPPPLYVPYCVGATRQPRQLAAGIPNHLLLMPAEEEIFIGREERGYYGSYQLGGQSAYTEFTYDSQPIGGGGESAYKYRYVYKSAISVP